MNCVILQPSYIPWRGFFDQVHKADVFVFYDCVQYDDRGWRNRNQIKTPSGLQWLSIPVHSRGVQVEKTAVKDIRIVWDGPWNKKHLRALQANYCKSKYFTRYWHLLEKLYERRDEFLGDFTCHLIEVLARELGIAHTRFVRSSTLPASGAKTDRLLSILSHLGATHYISGPSAKSYLEVNKLSAAGISIEFMNYDYPAYPQLYGSFEPQVSVIDLLFNVGPDSPKYIWDR